MKGYLFDCMSIVKQGKMFPLACMSFVFNQGCQKNNLVNTKSLEGISENKDISISEAYLKRNELDQKPVRLRGFLHSVNGHLYLMESTDSQRKINIPDHPFLLEHNSWSREVVLTGKYQLSGNLSSDIVSPVSQIEITNPNNRR